jgi:hypothetical protein
MAEAGVPAANIKTYGKGSVASEFSTLESRRMVIGIRSK